MSAGTCASCNGAGVVEHHHPTGRLDGAYLDLALTVPLCLRCHAAVHATWEALGLARWCGDQAIEGLAMGVDQRLRRAGAAPTERTELRLRRLASTLARLGAVAPWVPVLAAAVVSWAEEMGEAT